MVKYRDRNDGILFMDLRRKGEQYERKYIQLTDSLIQDIVSTYHAWQRDGFETNYQNIAEFCYSANLSELEKNDWSLIPSKYIEFSDQDSNIDYDKEMKRIQKQFKSIFADEKDSQEKLLSAFKDLGYEINL